MKTSVKCQVPNPEIMGSDWHRKVSRKKHSTKKYNQTPRVNDHVEANPASPGTRTDRGPPRGGQMSSSWRGAVARWGETNTLAGTKVRSGEDTLKRSSTRNTKAPFGGHILPSIVPHVRKRWGREVHVLLEGGAVQDRSTGDQEELSKNVKPPRGGHTVIPGYGRYELWICGQCERQFYTCEQKVCSIAKSCDQCVYCCEQSKEDDPEEWRISHFGEPQPEEKCMHPDCEYDSRFMCPDCGISCQCCCWWSHPCRAKPAVAGEALHVAEEAVHVAEEADKELYTCLLYTSPSPRD